MFNVCLINQINDGDGRGCNEIAAPPPVVVGTTRKKKVNMIAT